MKATISFLLTLFVIQFYAIGQHQTNQINWQNFLPQSDVDKIVFFNTNGKNDRKLNQNMYSSFLYKADHGDSLTKLLPQYYENLRTVTDPSIIIGVITSMANDTCSDFPVNRCTPQYRDIILFYYKNKLVFTLKVCMECGDTVSMPYKNESKCLANNMTNVLTNILGVDLFGEKKW